MKHYKFILNNLRAVSTNRSVDHSKYGVSKSNRYRIFEAEFEVEMARKYRKEVDEIREYFDENKHCIEFTFTFYFPCRTKSGRIHKRAGDASNGVKPTEDALFQYLGIDDAFVMKGTFEKVNSKKDKIEIELKIMEDV